MRLESTVAATSIDAATNAAIAAGFFVFFAGMFRFSWKYCLQHNPKFPDFSPAEKADWCSRINSTIHAIVIVAGVVYAICVIDWDKDYLPMSSIQPACTVFSIAIGYFLFDLIVVIAWPVPMQWVFVIHHIVAVVPYIINNFVSACTGCQFGLLLFLLVEIATLPLNARGFMESMGRHDSLSHTRSIYATYVTWAVTRTLLPVYLLYVFWSFSYPADKDDNVCFYPNLICAHIIAAFCVGVFCFVHTPEIMHRWKAVVENAALPHDASDPVVAPHPTKHYCKANVVNDNYTAHCDEA
ncbi:hypothetical protein SPRG_12512 [Saprolegnia parasitica CBS 223.65]|uniref:TLC domain-containing protein n=1 Tax=Saprolegnia parasitica (strain CBS 223.65) TaxID=695850 RepID=A0A067BSF7_SAPPC|nr:hypothetical protein SPRG_12512 [Saprolegnia parasitica CBS 223.65]KDO21469.1 hypothetical protein SPRG_12512 [Saprolegnia parasitica CBS 223.65]|eukprot:XP_012207813.1 hypothetical protein SPRG_12512 [Saprolegnia parasitica CBS 223.65]